VGKLVKRQNATYRKTNEGKPTSVNRVVTVEISPSSGEIPLIPYRQTNKLQGFSPPANYTD
jgi:hypothetical protein